MPEGVRIIVTNTTPLIAFAVATGSLDILRALYDRVIVPLEVSQEILAAGPQAPGVAAFRQAAWLECRKDTVDLPLYLRNSLDRGEASVIQTAVSEGIEKVCSILCGQIKPLPTLPGSSHKNEGDEHDANP